MSKYFYLQNHPVYQDKYIIYFDYPTDYFLNGTSGSYDVFIARLLNLSYPDYLRWARDRLGAELIGKNKRYIKVLFNGNNPTVQIFIKVLNKRFEYIINEHDFPYIYKEENGEVKRIPFEEKKNEDNT
jgi:hypothetical protein